MSQVVAGGIQINTAVYPVAAPGPVCILSGVGDPNLVSNASIPAYIDVPQVAVSSVYLRLDPPDATHALYIKTAAGIFGQTAGTWTPK